MGNHCEDTWYFNGNWFSTACLIFCHWNGRTCTNLTEIKRPEHALRLFLRFAIARGIVVYGMTIMTKVFEIIQGITSKIMSTVSAGGCNGLQQFLKKSLGC